MSNLPIYSPDPEHRGYRPKLRSGAGNPRESLGAGRIIDGTFSIFFRRIPFLIGFGLIPAILANIAITSDLLRLDGLPFTVQPVLAPLRLIVFWLLCSAAIMAATANLVQSVKAMQPTSVKATVGCMTRSVLPITFLFLSIIIGNYIATIILVAPIYLAGTDFGSSGVYWILYLTAWIAVYFTILSAFAAAAPAIVLERKWFAFRRSLQLTKHYRWPCSSIFIVISVVAYLILSASELLFSEQFGFGVKLAVQFQLVAALLFVPALFGISAALIYMRLREIKEGLSADEIVGIFE